MLGQFAHLRDTGLVLALILVANGSPIFVRNLLYHRFSTPIDGGRTHADGRPILGPSKTWRGVLAAIGCTVLAGLLFSVPVIISLLIAGFSMAGDLLSSFFKRRNGVEPSHMFTGVDQIPESLLPALAVMSYFDLSLLDLGLIVFGFFVLNRGLSVILYKLNIRRRPF